MGEIYTRAARANPGARGPESEVRFAQCYARLRELAELYFRRDSGSWTLQPTALVHEAYLRLSKDSRLQWHSREHFLSYAARVMRQVLVDEARSKRYLKRRPPGGRCETLIDGMASARQAPVHVLDLEEALVGLETRDQRKAEIVQMRYFAGMTVQETAVSMGISEATVFREWRAARAWLSKSLEGGAA